MPVRPPAAPPPAGFRSPRARARFAAAREAAMASWPGPVRTVSAGTRFGTTHLALLEAPDAPSAVPFLLLNGKAGHAAQWYPTAAALAGRHPVYAADTAGEAGLGELRAVPRTPAETTAWLTDVITALGHPRLHLVGRSYGGWLALRYAAAAAATAGDPSGVPHRLASLTLLDPAGLAPVPARFLAWMSANGLLALAPHALRSRFCGLLHNPMLREREVLEVCVRGSLGNRGRVPFPVPLADADLAAVDTLARELPVRFLLAEHTVLHDSRAQLPRLRGLLPHAEAEVVAGTGHAMAHDAPEVVGARLLAAAGGSGQGR